MRPGFTIAIAVMLVSLDACGSTAGVAGPVGVAPSGVPVPGTAGFLYSASNEVVYLQWPVAASGYVYGTVKDDHISGSSPNQTVEDLTSSFTGSIDSGGRVSFGFQGSWGAVYGSGNANTLTLNLPQKGGGLQAVSFRSATPDDYNSALNALKDSVNRDNQQAQQQQRADQDINALANDFSSFDKIEKSLNSDLDNLGRQVADTDTRSTTTAQSAGKVKSEAASGVNQDTVCGDADNTAGDADNTAGAADNVSGVLDNIKAELAQLRSTITAVNGELGKVRSDDPQYAGSARTPGPADVQQVVDGANAAISRAATVANTQIDHTNDDVAAAFSAATAAANAGNCGATVTTPSAISHIS
jgi:hypothetical protein